uniref:Uncharacterized protein n=1 Tax=Cannabis sativa TaxID=3483 RepID=A0A803PW13_CANSA
MTNNLRVFVACFKDFDLLKKQNSALQEGLRKAKLDVATKDKEIKDLGKANNHAVEKAKKIEEQTIKKLEEKIMILTRDLKVKKEKN